MADFSDRSFAELPLDSRLLEALSTLGFSTATRIQDQAIPVLLAGHDLIGRARTGSGKTAAFGLPLLERVKGGGSPPRALVLAPTRELAVQVARELEAFAAGLPLSVATVYGGTPHAPQMHDLATATVVVGTPGRVRDHLERGTLVLSGAEMFVLDEADRMLQMGMIEDITRLLRATPQTCQVAMFSATMPPEIRRIAGRFLSEPRTVQVEETSIDVSHIAQQWTLVPTQHRREALVLLLQAIDRSSVLVFCNTRVEAAEMGRQLRAEGLAAASLHGDMLQPQRERVLQALRDGSVDILVATDVAARGLDIDHVSHVINLAPPRTLEAYVHRIGRTGRLGRAGTAITLVNSKGKKRLHALADALEHPITAIDLPVASSALRPDWARPAAQFGRPPPRRADDVNAMRLFCPIGRHHRIRASDLVGLLTKEAGLTGLEIGRVEVLERHSFIGVSKAVGARVLAEFPRAVLRGHAFAFAEARESPSPEA